MEILNKNLFRNHFFKFHINLKLSNYYHKFISINLIFRHYFNLNQKNQLKIFIISHLFSIFYQFNIYQIL